MWSAYLASTKKRYNDTAIQEPEPGTGTETAHNLCKLSHFITAGDINDNIFHGGGSSRENPEKYIGIRRTRRNGIRDALNSSLIYCLIQMSN